jgi:arabinogalactan oligomer / maltooligosaccharide transport system substrate-binding protein
VNYLPLLALALVLAACADPLALPPPTPAQTIPPARATSLPPTAASASTVQSIATPATQEPAGSITTTAATTRATTRPPLTLWASASEGELGLLETLASEWAAARGRALRVVALSPDALATALSATRLGDDPPDLIYADEGLLVALLADEQLQPLGAIDAALLPALEALALRDGQRWALPVAARGGLVLLYNRKLVPQPPATSDELLATANQLTADGRYGLVYNWPEARWLLPWLTGFGGTLQPVDGTIPALDTPALDGALALLQALRGAGPPPPATYRETSALFRNGAAAMTIDGDWAVAGYRAAADAVDLGIAPLPTVAATSQVAGPPLGGTYLMAHRALPADDLGDAQAFAALLSGPDAQRRVAAAGRLPALPAVYDDPAIQNDPLLAALARTAPAATPVPFTRAERCIWRAIDNALPALLVGEQDRPATMATLQGAAQACANTQ